jgi:flagellar protein FlaG
MSSVDATGFKVNIPSLVAANSTTLINSNASTSSTNNASATKKDSPEQTLNTTISHISPTEMKELHVSEKVVIKAIEEANKKISLSNKRFEYSVHEKTKSIMIKVINTDTNELIVEIPPEKVLDIISKMWDLSNGIIIDKKA